LKIFLWLIIKKTGEVRNLKGEAVDGSNTNAKRACRLFLNQA